MRKKYYITVLFIASLLFVGWGSTGHKIISLNSTLFFGGALSQFADWGEYLSQHASDADIRKSWDPTEGPKHYIDIDAFPEFLSNGRISQSFDSLVLQHGYSFVMDQGILPWTIIEMVDSLRAAFQRKDWNKAKYFAADLGHYVGDGHMPLHITKNYNGQLSGQNGIHSRYESNMIGQYSSFIQYSGGEAVYVGNVPDYVFNFLYQNFGYVDSLLSADLYAKSVAGTYNNLYYQKLWERTRNFTQLLFRNSSGAMADLFYTAWIDAGSPMITGVDEYPLAVTEFELEQNFPNPFNPSTKIRWYSSSGGFQKITVYDVLGNLISVPVNEYRPAGFNEIDFKAENLSGGVYFYKLTEGNRSISKKMILVK